MAMLTIQDYPVYDKYWYVVKFKNLMRVKLLPHYYLNPKAAQRSIALNYPGKLGKWYKVMSGEEVKCYFLNYIMSEGCSRFRKYTYPIWCVTKQMRKDYRTVMRRRLRRMGLLTIVDLKRSVKSKPQYIKPIINKQKHAMRNTGVIRVIQIERKPSYYWYVVLNKELSTKKGKLFKLNTLRFNSRNGELKQVCLHTLRTDLLTPYLIKDLKAKVNEKIKEGKKSKAYYRKATRESSISLVED